jgi:hypothetical protein
VANAISPNVAIPRESMRRIDQSASCPLPGSGRGMENE